MEGKIGKDLDGGGANTYASSAKVSHLLFIRLGRGIAEGSETLS